MSKKLGFFEDLVFVFRRISNLQKKVMAVKETPYSSLRSIMDLSFLVFYSIRVNLIDAPIPLDLIDY